MIDVSVKIWHITGYKGRDDYDGPSDNNMDFHVAMDSRFNKRDVEEIFFNRFSKEFPVVSLNAKEVELKRG